ncbi:hypothetical protein ACFQX6_53790 [Streptosporangium lutulentum]
MSVEAIDSPASEPVDLDNTLINLDEAFQAWAGSSPTSMAWGVRRLSG